MKDFDCCLIVSDLDNTLLRKDKTLSAYSIKILEACRAKGFPIAFATARSEIAVEELCKNFEPDLLISSGGALGQWRGKAIYKQLMSPKLSFSIANTALKHDPSIRVTAHTEQGVFWNAKYTKKRPPGYSRHRYDDFSKPFEKGSYCMSITSEDESFMRSLANDFPQCKMIKYTGETLYRVASRLAEKDDALLASCKALNMDIDKVMAFGDDVNDLGMIKIAGWGIAMANAIDELKVLADEVLPWSNGEDGVARKLEQSVLLQ